MDIKLKIIFLIVLSVLGSCMGNKTISYLKNCEEERNRQDEWFCITSVKELKENLTENRTLFYLGSDTSFHYFKYHHRTAFYSYDKVNRWAVMGFKIPHNEFLPKTIIAFKETNKSDDGYPVYVKEL